MLATILALSIFLSIGNITWWNGTLQENLVEKEETMHIYSALLWPKLNPTSKGVSISSHASGGGI